MGKNVYYSTNADYYCVDDLLYDQSDDENDVTILSCFDGNTFVEDKFRYEDKKYINSRRSCSYEFIDGVVRVSSYTDGEESLFEDFSLEAKGYHVGKPIVTDEKVYVLIFFDDVTQNELRIYANEYN